MGMTGMPLGGGDEYDEDAAYKPLAEINITPFVDVMLVLLIIFMVAAPLMVAGVPLDLPSSSAAKINREKDRLIVSMDAAGALFIRKDPVNEASIVPVLARVRASEGDRTVYVRADKTRSHGDVLKLLGKIGESGFQEISLVAEDKTGGRDLRVPGAEPK